MSIIDKVPALRVERLNDSNAPTWFIQMEAALVIESLFTDIVEIAVDTVDANGDPRDQADIDAEIEKKRTKRSPTKMAEARARMILSVEPGQLVHMRSRDPLDIWQDLKAVHYARGFASELAHRRKFLTMKMARGQKMSGWIGEVKAQAFAMLEIGIAIPDSDIILALTMGLPRSYENWIITLDATPSEQLTLDYVITRLLNEELRQKSTSSSSSSAVAATIDPNNVAMTAAKVPRPVEDITCFFCDGKGHYKNDCPEKKKWEAYKSAPGEAQGAIEYDSDWEGPGAFD